MNLNIEMAMVRFTKSRWWIIAMGVVWGIFIPTLLYAIVK